MSNQAAMEKARENSHSPLANLRRALTQSRETAQERGEYKIPMPFFSCLQQREE